MSPALTRRISPRVSVPGLVEEYGVDFVQPLECGSVARHDAAFKEAPYRHYLHHRNGKSKGAGAGYDKYGDRNGDGFVEVSGSKEPCDHGKEGDAMHDWRIQACSAIRDATVSGASALGSLHHAGHLGQEGTVGGCGRQEGQRIGEVHHARLQCASRRGTPPLALP